MRSFYILGFEITLNDDPELGGVGVTIYTCGCNSACFNCHNPQGWDIKNGKKASVEYFKNLINEKKDLIKYVAFAGGEPLLYPMEIYEIASYARGLGMKTILYTGLTHGYISYIMLYVMDVIVDGKYVDELKTGRFPASSNQNVYIKKNKLSEEEILELPINKI